MNNSLRILLVEDNPGDARLIRIALSEAGGSTRFDLTWADELSKAFESLMAGNPAAILLDLNLPDSQGLSTVVSMVEKVPYVPIIVLTGLDDEVLAIQAVQNGAQDYLVKNQLDANILSRTIRYAIERKQAEQALRESEERLSGMIGSAMDAIITIDEEQRITLFNLAAEHMFRCSAADVIGRPLDCLFPERVRSIHHEHVRNYGETEYTERAMGALGELSGLRADGGQFPIEASISQLEAGGQKFYTVILRDITERKLADDQLKYHARLLRHINDAVIATDDQLRITAWNRAAERMYGWSDEEAIGHTVSEILSDEFTDEQRAEAGELLKESTFLRGVRIYHRKDGRTIYVEANTIALTEAQGKMTGYVSVDRDITERKLAEQEIESLANFPSENTGPVLRFARDGRLLYANPASADLLRMWGCAIDDRPSDEIILIVYQSLVIPMSHEIEVTHGDKIDALMFVPIVDKDYVNVYGRDITERKQAEVALRSNEELFRTTFEYSPVGMCMTSLDGRLLNVNQALNAMLGFTEAELEEKFFDDITHPEDLEIDGNAVRRMLSGEITNASFEKRYLRKSGEPVWAQVNSTLLRDSTGKPIHFITHILNVTDRKRAEEEVLASERQMRALVTSLDDIVFEFDEQGTYLNVWTADESLLARPKAQLLGKRIDEVLGAENGRPFSDALRRVLATGQSEIIEYPLKVPEGQRWFLAKISPILDHGGSPQSASMLIRDITGRKQAEEKIRHQLERLNSLRTIDTAISSSFDIHVTLDIVLQQVLSQLGVDAAAILLVNPHEQTIEYAASRGFRSKALHHTQLKLNEGYAGRPVHERQTIHITDLVATGGKLAEAMQLANEDFVDYYGTPLVVKEEIKGVLEIYHRTALHPKAEWLDFLETLAGQSAIAIDNAQLFESLQRSNTELEHRVSKRTEELMKLNIELEHANRAKDEFLATMSHELRTPLNSILGLSETLLEQRRDPLSEHQQRSLQTIQSSGSHLLELINDILDLSKIEAGKVDYYPQIIIVGDLCRGSLAFVNEQANRKSITITYQEETAVSKVYADLRRIKQILVNLLTNAIKFTPAHGQVILQVRADTEQDRIQFSVIDTGIGIALKDLKRLFVPFSQVDSSLTREYEGTGLGLALVQKLTDLHGGSVDVESEVGKGSRFTINLPLGQAMIAQQEVNETGGSLSINEQLEKSNISSSEEQPGRGKILLAEDNLANILTIGDYLESRGYQVVVAQDGLEAIQKAEEIKPDIILMDIQMPVLDGLETIRLLRADPRFASTPIIALTALAMPGDRERCLETGANEYMSKPASLKELVKVIAKFLKEKSE